MKRLAASLFAGASIASALFAVQATGAQAATHGLGAIKPKNQIAPTNLGSSAKAKALTTQSLPASVNLKSYAVTAGNQGSVNSCVAWAIGHSMMGWYANKAGKSVNTFAPMYLYSQINAGMDSGSVATDALHVTGSQGIDTAADYQPQGDFDWQDQPTAAQKSNAAQYRTGSFDILFQGYQSGTLAQDSIQAALAAGKPVAIGFVTRPGFSNLNASYVDTDSTGTVGGGHEVLALGYDSNGLLIENSWGTGYGNNGFAYLAWNVVNSDVFDAETLSNANGFATATAPVLNSSPVTVTGASTGTLNVSANFGTATSGTVSIFYGQGPLYLYWQQDSQTQSHSGTGNNTFSFPLTGLVPSTQYYYDVRVSSAGGEARNVGQTFYSQGPPVENTLGSVLLSDGLSASLISNTQVYAATSGTATWKFGTSTSYGTTYTQNITHSGTNIFNYQPTGLNPTTQYHYQLTVTTPDGTVTSPDKTFWTKGAPVENTLGAIPTSGTTASLISNTQTYGATTSTATWKFGTSTSYGTTYTQTATGEGTHIFSYLPTGLSQGVLYHYQLTVTTPWGTVVSPDQTFYTLAPPVENTLGALQQSGGTSLSLVSNTNVFGATSGTATWKFGPTSSYGTTYTQSITHNGVTILNYVPTGLTPGATYHYQLTVTTPDGTVVSPDKTATTSTS